MNRRKAVGGLLLSGIAGLTAFSGYKWYNWSKIPDIVYLEKKSALIAALAETIIPASDSPGALESGVHEFIIKNIKDCADVKTRNVFIDGLKDVENYSNSRYGRSFQDCTPKDQFNILNHFENTGKGFTGIAGKVQNRILGKPFFSILKEYTVTGYCTSELGATKGLRYLHIPGAYQSCIKMESGQTAWATK